MPDLRPAQPVMSPIGGPSHELRIERTGSRLLLQYPWRRADHVLLLMCACAVAGVLATAAIEHAEPLLRTGFIAALVPMAVVLYASVAGLVNRTFIEVNVEVLAAYDGPLPWR